MHRVTRQEQPTVPHGIEHVAAQHAIEISSVDLRVTDLLLQFRRGVQARFKRGFRSSS